MAYGSFRTYQSGLLPPWLADAQGQAFEATFGATKDAGMDLYRQAAKARWPDAARPDALPYQAHDRLTFRAPPETNTQFAARLVAAPDTALWWGTPTAMVNIFAPYGYTANGGAETLPIWQSAHAYQNGDQIISLGFIYEMAAANGSVSGTVPPTGAGGTGHGNVPQPDSFIDGACLWNYVRQTAAGIVVAANYQVILEGGASFFSRYIMLLSAGFFTADTPWDAPVDVWPDSATLELWGTTMTLADYDYAKLSVRTTKSDWSFPVLLGIQEPGSGGDGMWDQLPGETYDFPGSVWDTGDGSPIYLPLGETWNQEANLYGVPTIGWVDTVAEALALGEVWGDYVPPSTGWSTIVP